MRIISKKTETQFVPIPVSTEGAKILLTKSVYKKDGTGTYAYLTDQHLLPNGLTLWIRGELLHYDTVEVSEEEYREPTLEELGELSLLAFTRTWHSFKDVEYIKYLGEKYPDYTQAAYRDARGDFLVKTYDKVPNA